MLFDSLDKIKRNSIFSAILLMALGAVMLLCPEAYISSFTLGAGYVLVIIAMVMMLDFFTSKKSLMDYILFVAALLILILGGCVLVFSEDIMSVLARLFGILLVADGARTIFHAFTYARRSERKGWWVLVVLSVLLIIAGCRDRNVRGVGIWAAVALAMMFMGPVGMAAFPAKYFGIFERFSTFAAVGYNMVLGIYLFNGF